MIRATLSRLALACALVVSLPAAAGAQVKATSPEGVEWHLAGYAPQGEVGIVPWYVDPTLILEDGTANGTSGCNRFSTGYTLVAESLVFDQAMTMTRMACPGELSDIEDAYTAALVETATWAIEDDVLSLFDDAGRRLLDFERAVVSLTPSDIAAIAARFDAQQAQIDHLGERVDNIRIGTVRDRIKALESKIKTLGSAASSSSSSGSTFSSAEKQLLKGISNRIRNTCAPLRTGLPSGTLAAVRCDPGSSLVADMAYYLLPYDSAERTFTGVMDRHGVPERYRCMDGRQSQALQSPYHATGCFVDSGAANLRLVTWAASCQQLDVNSKRVREPVAYVAIEGTGNRIKPLYEWATSDGTPAPVWTDIPAGGNPPSPGCVGPAG